MKLYIIRHGEPDYEHDCLTETGRKQAMAAAERLKDEGFDEIYTSPNGRARETAKYTAEKVGLAVTTLDFMHEISWGGEGVPANGHLWTLSNWMITEEDYDFGGNDWREHPYFKNNTATGDYAVVTKNIDEFLKKHGYTHDGTRFLCTTDKREKVAIFCHGGSGACVLSHVLSLPFPYTLTVLPYGYTSVIEISFPVLKGEYVHPRIELFNDMMHTRDIPCGPEKKQEF